MARDLPPGFEAFSEEDRSRYNTADLERITGAALNGPKLAASAYFVRGKPQYEIVVAHIFYPLSAVDKANSDSFISRTQSQTPQKYSAIPGSEKLGEYSIGVTIGGSTFNGGFFGMRRGVVGTLLADGVYAETPSSVNIIDLARIIDSRVLAILGK